MNKQSIQLNNHNKRAKERFFFVGDTVSAMNFAGSTKWLRRQTIGLVSFTVLLEDGKLWKRHTDNNNINTEDMDTEIHTRKCTRTVSQLIRYGHI